MNALTLEIAAGFSLVVGLASYFGHYKITGDPKALKKSLLYALAAFVLTVGIGIVTE